MEEIKMCPTCNIALVDGKCPSCGYTAPEAAPATEEAPAESTEASA